MKDLALNSCYETTFIGQTFKVLPSRAQDSTLSACPTTAGANKRSMPRTAKTKKRIILDTTEPYTSARSWLQSKLGRVPC
jgi:hypothetical protein